MLRHFVISVFCALVAAQVATANAATIDKMFVSTFGHYWQYYTPGGGFLVFPRADYYQLSDGTSWDAGAGWSGKTESTPSSVSVAGGLITYTFNRPASGLLFANTDYDSGDHSAQGQLGLPERIQITATFGSTTGQMDGYTEILSNNQTWYGYPRFNHYSAKVGQSVFFSQVFQLQDDRFTQDLFSRPFSYNEWGVVDFTRVQSVPEPSSLALLAAGAIGLLAYAWRRYAGDR